MFSIYLKKTDQCTSRELSDFKNTLLNRSDINKENLDQRILRAKFLAFYYLESRLIGIGAIKSATPGFRNRILAGQVIQLVADLPESEIGWFYIHDNFRGKGIGSYILSELLKVSLYNHLFAVTSSENREMRHLLTNNNFSFSGEIKLNEEKNYFLYFRNE